MTTTSTRSTTARRISITSAALAAGGAIALAGCGSSSHEGHSTAASSSVVAAAGHNAADAMFVQMMTPHHEQAVEMSDMLLEKQGIDARVVSLAREIKAAQGPEITTMTQWASSWGVSADDGMDHSGMDHGSMGGVSMSGSMSGMMSADDMNRLRSAQGVDAAKLFLDQMIEHHTGAITMAQNEIRSGKDAAAKQLAQSIATTQQREIATMRQLLTQL